MAHGSSPTRIWLLAYPGLRARRTFPRSRCLFSVRLTMAFSFSFMTSCTTFTAARVLFLAYTRFCCLNSYVAHLVCRTAFTHPRSSRICWPQSVHSYVVLDITYRCVHIFRSITDAWQSRGGSFAGGCGAARQWTGVYSARAAVRRQTSPILCANSCICASKIVH